MKTFLLVNEPDNGTADCSLNIDFVKLMTGGDEISARQVMGTAPKRCPDFSSESIYSGILVICVP